MERIVIEVADETAKKWRLTSQQLRDEYLKGSTSRWQKN